SADSEQQLHRELIEFLVRVAAAAHRRQIERALLQLARSVGTECDARAGLRTARRQFAEQSLNLRVGVEGCDLLFEDQIRAHAASREIPDALLVFRAIGVAVEVSHATPLRVLEQLHEEERAFDVLTAEAKVLIEAPRLLRVEVDVEELVRLERLRDT